jgi:hypothetical protein
MSFDVKRLIKEWRRAVKDDPTGRGNSFYVHDDGVQFVVSSTMLDDDVMIEQGLTAVSYQQVIPIMEASNKAEDKAESDMVESSEAKVKARSNLGKRLAKLDIDDDLKEILSQLL